MSLILDAAWKLRRERDYVLLYKLSYVGFVDDYKLITPQAAILFSLFDGERTTEQVAEALSYVTGLHPDISVQTVNQFLDEYGNCLVDISQVPKEQIRIYNPLKFVMNTNDVDLTPKRLIAPLFLVYMVTNACCANCIYCYAGKQEEDGSYDGGLMPLPRVKEFLQETAELEIPTIIISGGDPFMHPNILEILEQTISLGILPNVSTKCILPKGVVDRLSEIGLKRLQISVDSPYSETVAFMTGVRNENYLQGIISTIKRVVRAGITVETNMVITSYNLRHIPELVDILQSLGVRSIGLSNYVISFYRHSDDILLSEEDLDWLEETVNTLREKYKGVDIKYGGRQLAESLLEKVVKIGTKEREKYFARRTRCTAGMRQLAIYPDGKVVPCEEAPPTKEFVFGNLKRQSIKEIWNSERLIEVIRPPREKFIGQPCYDCLDFYECHAYLGRCYMHALKAYGTPYAPPPECPKAPSQSGLFLTSKSCE